MLAMFGTLALAEIKKEEGVLVLTNDNFQEAVDGNEFILVEFYAPWCGHCKAMKADYALAAKILTEERVSHVLATVDATIETDLAKRFDIRGYPTLKFFSKGKEIEDYKGGRKKDDIVKFIRQKATLVKDEL